jgi:hypothetical protein
MATASHRTSSPLLLSGLNDLVDRVMGQKSEPPEFTPRLNPAVAPDPVVAPDAGDFFRVVLLDQVELCNDEDCENETRLAVESRDQAPLPYCHAHAHVLFADWMVGA